MIDSYLEHTAQRAALGVPPLPLDAEQVDALVARLEDPSAADGEFLVDLLANRIPPGVDPAARVKAGFLAAIATGAARSPWVDTEHATRLLGTMLGGYNVETLISLLDDPTLRELAAEQLALTLLVFDAFHDVVSKARAGNANAQTVLAAWSDATWFTRRPEVAEKIALRVFRVPGETNTDDLSPAPDAWSRPDIPLHALSILKARPDATRDAAAKIAELRAEGHPVVYVGDIVGTGSSRKSATNSLLWHLGSDIPHVPNKRSGGFVLGGKIAPIFFNTLEDSGALPIECDVSKMAMGDVIVLYPYAGRIETEAGDTLAEFQLATPVLLDEVRAGGRIPLIIGRSLTDRAREALGLGPSEVFRRPSAPDDSGFGSDSGFTLAQKIVGRACGTAGVRPGSYCEPRISTVGSQDTTGPMTRDELTELACLGFSADLVLQSFCHTSAYPKPVDLETQHTLPDFVTDRGGISLRPGDGIIHSWLNRMLVPDQVGTGADSHTRFPLGISFPAGSGLVAFAAAMGVMPLDMPESVRVRFSGELQPGITLRDLVNAIPYLARKRGLLSAGSEDKRNVFSGRILEIEGLPDLTVEQAFELSDASAERSAGGCTIELSEASVRTYLRSNVVMLRWLIGEGYGDARTLERRAQAMETWLADPVQLRADASAHYVETLEIDIGAIREPLLACPNDPDDVRKLSDVSGTTIDEVFIGSCMTNIGHFRAAGRLLEAASGTIPTRLWIAPPTKMDRALLEQEGFYDIYAAAGARVEPPGCSLCMGNQARVAEGATVVSTSTRNFPNRLGKNADVFLASAELAAVAAILGRIPTPDEYLQHARHIDTMAPEIYRYLEFDSMPAFASSAGKGQAKVAASGSAA